MSSEISSRKRQANRENARKSTGPRTERGKAIAAGNALRHGIFAQRLLLPGEDPAELRRLKCDIVRRLNPRDALELRLVERIIVHLWKLQRLQRIERCLYVRKSVDWDQSPSHDREDYGLDAQQPTPVETIWASSYPEELDRLERLEKQEHRLENSLNRSLRQLAALRKEESDDAISDLASDVLRQEEAAGTSSASAAAPGSFDEHPQPTTEEMANEAAGELDKPLVDPALPKADLPATDESDQTPQADNQATQQPPTNMPNQATRMKKTDTLLSDKQRAFLNRLERTAGSVVEGPPLHELSLARLQKSVRKKRRRPGGGAEALRTGSL